jgi:dTDP-glucose pyrophosphorylase
VISPTKWDLVAYYGATAGGVAAFYVVQPRPAGLCDAVFRVLPFIDDEEAVAVGLPDTVWFPEDGLRRLSAEPISFLLFPVTEPQRHDAVVTDERGWIREIQVKQSDPRSSWVWGAFKASGRTLRELEALWEERDRLDTNFGTLVNAYLQKGHQAFGVRAGREYVDVGAHNGYHEARSLIARRLQDELPDLTTEADVVR